MGKNGLNKVMLMGNLGRDPEQKFLQNGGSVCTFSLGTTESFSKDGEQKERTEWAVEKIIFPRLLKKGQMQGSRNPEE